jgi:aminopeptidase N
MLLRAALSLVLATAGSPAPSDDPRSLYDVQTYRLDLAVDPRTKTLSGTAAVESTVVGDSLAKLVLDLKPLFEVQSVVELPGPVEAQGSLAGANLAFERKGAALSIFLPQGRKKGDSVRVAVTYSGKPTARDSFAGFHWKKTSEGKPWICTSCQDEGSSSWWPCKDSFWHPEDKPERTFVNLTVPDGLTGVSNGRLTGHDKAGEGAETFHWVHEYPCETYSIAIAVAPYVVVEQDLQIEGLEGQLPFVYYTLPEDAEKAKLQFAQAPRMLEIYSKAFGPFPFPKSKFALVETCFWGMEHSTCVAYGSSFPAWCAEHGAPDPYAQQNRQFDYILVHESAHEWWGNGVSAKSWGHFWIHEGFATYAEAVYLEELEDRDAADEHLEGMKAAISKDSRLFRGENVDSEQAYGHVIYVKGAWVLNTLRHYVDDDEVWWKTLRDFNLAFRYKNADTEDFRTILETNTKKSWKTFFDEWFYGEGYPMLDGTVTARAKDLLVQVQNQGSGKTGFHVPLDLTWREGKAEKKQRLMLEPGPNRIEVPCKSKPREVEVGGLEHVLGEHAIRLE